MNFIERFMGKAKKRTESNKEGIEAELKKRLKSVLYDDELVEEIAPAFLALQGNEHLNTVFDLLEAKERQIEALTGGEWFNQSSTEGDETISTENNDAETTNLVDDYLSKKYGEK